MPGAAGDSQRVLEIRGIRAAHGVAMDIDLLRTFVAICDTRTFTAAARQVGRTQSAVSLQMRRLEDSLGRPLFQRGGARPALTEHGVLLLAHARRILAAVAEARLAFDQAAVEGVVVLGMPDDYAPRILSRVLRSFSELYPAATVDLVIDQSRQLVRRLAEGSVDLAFVTAGEGPVSGDPVFRDRIVWTSAAAGATTGEVHLRDPLPVAIWGETETYSRLMFDALAASGRAHRVAVISRSMAGLRGAVRAGIAVSAMMSSSVGPGMRALGEEDGFPPMAELPVHLERTSTRRSAVIGRLEAHIRACLPGPG
jgi:DNA-binding transcriptional LysR family regulator